MRKTNHVSIPEAKPFDLSISYIELDRDSPENEFNHHTHPECEIYINLAGDVSFMVESTIYPVKKGDIIITRPFEYHHCIYHSNAPHKLFWILFSSRENENMLPAFFKRNLGENNRISLSSSNSEKIFKICNELVNAELDDLKKQIRFLQLIDLINNGDSISSINPSLSPEMVKCMHYINDHLSENISISSLAEFSGMSVNTLERHFKKYLNLSPHNYLQNQRLSHAASLLESGCSVTTACERSGFPDYSHFIALFKKRYGKTPVQYKKSI